VAFAMLVGAFSLIVTQFQSISIFAAVVARLSSLIEAIEKSQTTRESAVEPVEREGCFVYERLTLLSSDGTPLLKELSASIPQGTLVLLTGSGQAPGTALFNPVSKCDIGKFITELRRRGVTEKTINDAKTQALYETKAAASIATAGIPTSGTGRIIRPGPDESCFSSSDLTCRGEHYISSRSPGECRRSFG
jgi:hypothetical protein